MNTRLIELRKMLGVSQREFGNKINLSHDIISFLEKGTRRFTKRVKLAVCREFNVNSDWFEIGQGSIFQNNINIIDEFNNIDKEMKEIIRVYMKLEDDSKRYIKDVILYKLKSK